MLKNFYACCLIAAFVPVFGCGPSYTQTKLPSGKTIKVHGVSHVSFSNAPPLLNYQYITDSAVSDIAALREEAEEIWMVFRPRVEKEKYSQAAITAMKPRRSFLGFWSSVNYGFVVQRNPNGTWTHLDWGRDYDAEELALATAFIEELTERHFTTAAKQLHYLASFPSEEQSADIQAMASHFEVTCDKLGAIRDYSINSTRLTFHAITLKTATEEYWLTHPEFDFIAFDVNYEAIGKGYLKLTFSVIEQKLVVRSVRFCIPDSLPGGPKLVKDTLARMTLSEQEK